MDIVSDPQVFQRQAAAWRRQGLTTALVPTMGYFHEGHVSLMRLARSRADKVMVSLFVNPTQFGPGEDLSSYPRDLDRDRELLASAGTDLVFAPEPEALYAPDASTWVEETRLASGLCGASRPGHFRGVCTVVLKLFQIVGPQRAIFGEKDYQQLQVIRRMVRDLDVPVEVVGCPLVREPDGLARSSRNVYLSPEERSLALGLSRALEAAQEAARRGDRDASSLVRTARERLEGDSRIQVDYLELVDPQTLERVPRLDREARLVMAVRVGRTRLLDNGPLIPETGR